MSKFILTLVLSVSMVSSLEAQITSYISDAVGQNNIANRAIADTQDDDWRAALSGAISCPVGEELVIEQGTISGAELPTVLSTTLGTTASISLQNMTNAGIGTAHNSQGTASGAGNTNMQDNSPKPASLVNDALYNENRGSAANPNGFLFTFSPAVDNFGGWFGDLETRTEPRDDGFACSPSSGTTAVLRLIDTMGNITNIDILPNATTDQSLCGAPVDDDFVGCGNRQTRWVGFTSTTPIAQMVVIVGDDDTTCSGSNTADAGTEHISFMGATHAECQVALPVELASFEASSSSDRIDLSWTTLSESNNAGFEVEHASLGREFSSVGFVEGHGQSNSENSYSFAFQIHEPGIHQFRLKQIDFDGEVSYSPVINSRVELQSAFFIEPAYPNPFTDQTRFKLAVADDQNVKIDLYDQLGKHVRTIYDQLMEANQTEFIAIDGSGLSNGIYFYQVRAKNFRGDGKVSIIR